MDTQGIVVICAAGLVAVFMIVNAIVKTIEKGRLHQINLATERTATTRAETVRETAVARGKEADATAEGERTKRLEAEIADRTAQRAELTELGFLRGQESASSGTVTPLARGGKA